MRNIYFSIVKKKITFDLVNFIIKFKNFPLKIYVFLEKKKKRTVNKIKFCSESSVVCFLFGRNFFFIEGTKLLRIKLYQQSVKKQ